MVIENIRSVGIGYQQGKVAVNNRLNIIVKRMISKREGNAIIRSTSIRSESGSTINGRDFTDGVIHNKGRVVTIKKKRTHLRAFVREINIIATQTSETKKLRKRNCVKNMLRMRGGIK